MTRSSTSRVSGSATTCVRRPISSPAATTRAPRTKSSRSPSKAIPPARGRSLRPSAAQEPCHGRQPAMSGPDEVVASPTEVSTMQYRRMGGSDLEVSAIGFGCWEMGGNQYGEVDDQEEVAAVHRAIDLGVTLFDTAAIYGHGHSEEVLGRALGARRREVVLVTKGGLGWT